MRCEVKICAKCTDASSVDSITVYNLGGQLYCSHEKERLVIKPKKSEEQKLIDYFNSAEGSAQGQTGDARGFTPAETAIHFMRREARLTSIALDFRNKMLNIDSIL